MIIIQLAGGLGNQLQQYALYRKFVRLGKETRLDISWFTDSENQGQVLAKRSLELDSFDRLIYETCTGEEKETLIGSRGITGKLRRKLFSGSVKKFEETDMYHPEIFALEDAYITGYFACEKYYSDIMYDLRERIQFPPSTNSANIQMAAEMKERKSVSVHIRRGDYLDPENAEMFGNICTEKYYEGAIREILEKVPDAHFYLFSDDTQYVRHHYKGDEYTVIDWNHGEDSFYDMWLMSKCKHNICANSTFSFWGARLNDNQDKLMIRPTIHKNSQVFDADKMHDLWEGWILMDKNGEVR